MWPFGSIIPSDENFLRFASPNERRCISREDLGFYRALVVGGIYEFASPVDTSSIITYADALRQCIDRHPELSVNVGKAETESSYYKFCPRIDLRQHIQFLARDAETEHKSIQQVLPGIVDAPWPPSIPFWKIYVLPFSETRCFIGFSFSHNLGDGISAKAFHRTFLAALQSPNTSSKDLICTPAWRQLRPAFDTPENLPISWSFLLSPLLGAYLPDFLARLFGYRASISTITPGTWTGSLTFHNPETDHTGTRLFSIDAATLGAVLKACRKHGAKMTGLLHQLICTALSEALPKPHSIDNFGAGTAMNMRRNVGESDDQMGLFVSGCYYTIPFQAPTEGKFSWDLARLITDQLATVATKLDDQPIGLLRYLTSIRSWTLSKLGQVRDDSYEISNLLVFRPLGTTERCKVTEMIFSRPGSVPSGPLGFDVISAENGPLNITVSWQVGALDLGEEKDEVAFVEMVCREMKESFIRLANEEESASSFVEEK